jgi:hypothetical protein
MFPILQWSRFSAVLDRGFARSWRSPIHVIHNRQYSAYAFDTKFERVLTSLLDQIEGYASMTLKSLIFLGSIALLPVSLSQGVAANMDRQGSAQAFAQSGLAAAEQLRFSVLSARLDAQRLSLEAEQNELTRITNGGLLPQAELATRTNAFRAQAARFQAAARVLNADMAMAQRAQSQAASRPGSGTEVTGNNITWVLTEKAAYFANPDRTWTCFDSDRPMAEAVYRELSRAAGFVIMLDERTGLRRSIDFSAGNIRIQQTATNEQFVPIMGVGAEVHGQNVMRVTYPGGEMRLERPGVWIERQRGRTIGTLTELKRTRDMVQLMDKGRAIDVFLMISDGKISAKPFVNPSQSETLRPVTSAAARYIAPGPVID